MRSTRRSRVACGVDVGSTNVKVVLLAPDGEVVARVGRSTPRDPAGLCIEGAGLLSVVEEMIAQACSVAFEVHTICVAGVGEDGFLVDERLNPITPALPWFDARRQDLLHELRPDFPPDDSFDAVEDAGRTLVGWAWARRQPGASTARSWVSVADFPAVKWTKRTFLSDTLASRTGAWRARDGAWSLGRVLPTLGDAHLLPTVAAAGDVIGELDAPTLMRNHIVGPDAIVVAGGHDHPIGGWGVEQLVPGAVLDSMGTAEVIVAQRPEPPGVRKRDGVDIAPGIRSTGTTLLRVEELSRNVAWACQDLEVAASIHEILEQRSVPDFSLEGAFLPGSRGGGAPRYAAHAPQDPRGRASAVLVALAHLGRDAVEAVRSDPADHSGVRLAGGWARSPGWVAIKQRVNGYSTEPIAEPEVTAVGAAMLAASARGWDPDPSLALG